NGKERNRRKLIGDIAQFFFRLFRSFPFVAIFSLQTFFRGRVKRGEIDMITKRDSLVAILWVCATLGAVTLAQSQKPLMGSSIFDWNDIKASPTKVGST